ncbi:MAG TPA: TIGR03087 family PEP-CTERM/XrtA system glycosyltransferase [Planctomycetota bacterium]|jgi:sugar transferase (PEP-CTERM/EpsH1 system associated)|nr:TIGR03087 family PEP-CTERM/XrtA system glycosyltransferase [Planctomycetota bacterium]
MKILYVCHRFPYPPQRGGKIRPFNMIRHLSASGHEVHVASIARSAEEALAGRGLEKFCASTTMGRVRNITQNLRMAARLFARTPSSMGYFYSRELDQGVRDLMRKHTFDLIFVHCSSVAQYVCEARGIPKILDFGDMDSQKWKIYSKFKPWPLSTGYWLEGAKLEREERRLAKLFDLCTCTTKAELATLNSFHTGTETDWFPNGVDHQYFKPEADSFDSNRISFIGRMDYYPNQECMIRFCQEVLPLIRSAIPTVQLDIIGAEPTPEIKRLEQHAGVRVTGSVPDVRPFVRKSAAMVAPLQIARGTQNKILEAMAMGVPVVSSDVAADGIDAIPDEHFLVARNAQEYSDKLIALMADPDRRQHYAVAGRARMLSHHDWSGSLRRLDTIIERCVAKFSGQAPVHQHASTASKP